MPAREADVEGAHESFFFETLGRAVHHPGVEIPDIPAIGDRHVACVRPAVDEDNAILAKQAVIVGVVDKARDEKTLLRPRCKIFRYRGTIVEFGKPEAGMRTARTDNDRKLE